MTEGQREDVSALIDGELDGAALDLVLDEIEQDDELRGVWSRYHLLGCVLRGEQVHVGYESAAAQVGQRLKEEVPVPVPLRKRPIRPSWVGPAAGYALAASAALVAVFALPPLFEGQQAPQGAMTAQTLTQANRYRSAPRNPRPGSDAALESKLNTYVLSHQEYSPAGGFKGVLPYATFVSYEGRR